MAESRFAELKEKEKLARKQIVIESALALFAKKPFYEVGMREVADEAGISPATIYRYFPSQEELFNEVYDQEHVPSLLKVPGVIAVTRFKTEPAALMMGGEKRAVTGEGQPRYSAMYEVESPDVLLSDAWAAAVEEGRWPDEVRPYTSNRQHVLRKVV